MPAFVERALELRRQMRDEILREGIASRVERVRAWIAGCACARSSQIKYEFRLDSALLKELCEHEKQAAQELGQWTEHVTLGDLRTARVGGNDRCNRGSTTVPGPQCGVVQWPDDALSTHGHNYGDIFWTPLTLSLSKGERALAPASRLGYRPGQGFLGVHPPVR
ncbi:MAG TPA: hypothetical protein VLN59_12595 [Burkholderiales bacterium]|nr:hypothetical protein [Burkholderiales bacterium]